MRRTFRGSRADRSSRHRCIRHEPIEGYLDEISRIGYLKQKMAAQNRMWAHDAQDDPEVRAVFNAAGSIERLFVLWNKGIRTFEDAERAIAEGL